MKLSLLVKISIKDFFPKNENIPYDNFICLFTHHNFNGKISLSNLANNNSIKHKTESFNSNIIYNLHMLDAKKNSLIGIYQLIIFFDKIKNLNINDTLTQDDTAKLIIDSKTKRKIFDKIYSIGDIYLNLLTEVKILDKKICENECKSNNKNRTGEKEITYININYTSNKENKLSEFNLTPRSMTKNKMLKSIKNDRDAMKRIETITNYNELSAVEFLDNNRNYNSMNSMNNQTPKNCIKKNKSLQKLNKYSIVKNTKKNKNTQIISRHRAMISSSDVLSPSHNRTNYNFNFKRDDNKKDIPNQTNKKKQLPKKKTTILNLLEEKMSPSTIKNKDITSLELNSQSMHFKNTSSNFNKGIICKVNNNTHIRKNSSKALNNYHSINSFNSREKIKCNPLIKKNSNNFDENDFLKKKSKNIQTVKRKISVHQKDKNTGERTISNQKNENEFKIKKIVPKKLSLNEAGRLYTDMNNNKNNFTYKKNININLNNAFLKTEIVNRKLSEMKINLKKCKSKNILTDIDLEQLIIEKGTYIKGNFHNNYTKPRGAFSPKLTIKYKYKENSLSNNNTELNTEIKFRQERLSNKYPEKTNAKILTPKAKQKRLNSFSNTFTNNNNDNNCLLEKEEIKKKYINLIDFYFLLSKKLSKTNKNNFEIIKNYAIAKEKYNYLLKKKNKLIQRIKNNESIKVKNKALFHFEEEQLLNKIVNIKIKEHSLYQNIFGNDYGNENMRNRLDALLAQKKEMMLSLIRNIVKFYGNITEIYNNDRNKKNLLMSLLNKHHIKEKVKIDLSYISHMHKENNFEDKIITEVDEDKENEEEDDGEIKQDNNMNINLTISNNDLQTIKENNTISFNKENKENIDINKNKNIEVESDINNDNKHNVSNSNSNIQYNVNNNSYDESLNNLIRKILIEQFPQNYNTNNKFLYQEKNKYSFGNKTFIAFIEHNDVVLKEEFDDDNNKYTLNEFYLKFCAMDKKENKSNFVYTKKIKQKYIKLKNNDKEQSLEKKPKNENSTTISENVQSNCSKLNEMGEFKNSMSEENKSIQ